ncbi:MAG: hypothetical protein J3K34DRAFT_510765 [Monoraphidium minutum]|nr:MAG: hypothetical protein J3K34DRAFT_510765 [Monoraphidium minutum]
MQDMGALLPELWAALSLSGAGAASGCPFASAARAYTGAQAAAALLRARLPWAARMQLAGAAALLAAALLAPLRRLPPGAARAAAALPLLVPVNLVIPLLFDPRSEIISRAVSAASFAWMANCKVAAFCLGRGALAAQEWGLLRSALICALPIVPRQRGAAGKAGRLGDSAGAPGAVAARFAGYCGFLLVMMWVLAQPLPPIVIHWVSAYGLYAFVSAVMGGPALLLGLIGLEVVPPFDRPWLSTSLADFWGRRWNNSIGQTLRCLTYDPIVEGRLVAAGGGDSRIAAAGAGAKAAGSSAGGGGGGAWRRGLGMALTFVASGLFHELLFWYVSLPYTWGMSSFFFAQIPLVLLETAAVRALAGRAPPAPLRIALVQVALLATAHAWFFPPLDHADTTAKFTAAVVENGRALAAAVARGTAAVGVAL